MRMKTLDLTQKQVAQELGVTQGAVSLWINFKNTPTVQNANAMKRLYGWDTEIWDSPEKFYAFWENNTHLFGNLKIPRKANNGNAQV